jgi:AcrR family transcriptional regulator
MFEKKKRSAVGYQLLHDCMRVMLQSLRETGREGVEMDCTDGVVRRMYLIIAAYIANYPEQWREFVCLLYLMPRRYHARSWLNSRRRTSCGVCGTKSVRD